VNVNRSSNVVALGGLVDAMVVDPAVPMGGHLPPLSFGSCTHALFQGGARVRIPFEGHADGEDRARHLFANEKSVEPPESGPRPVVVQALHVHVPLAICARGGDGAVFTRTGRMKQAAMAG
jgi:hypothetical protein